MSENTPENIDETTTPQAEVSTEESAAPQAMEEHAPLEGEVTGEAPSEANAAPQQEAEEAEPGEDLDARDARILELEGLVDERTQDLQRLQAEYVNYKKRVDRDRAVSKQLGAETVVMDLIPVLDAIELARQHDDITEGFQMVADALAKLSEKHGLVSFGAVGEPFDPTIHDALMQVPLETEEPITQTTISQVMQIGYRLGDRVLRPARVGVANPA